MSNHREEEFTAAGNIAESVEEILKWKNDKEAQKFYNEMLKFSKFRKKCDFIGDMIDYKDYHMDSCTHEKNTVKECCWEHCPIFKEEIKVANQEQISVPYLDKKFKVMLTTLDIGDVLSEIRKKLTELKIGADVHDYARLTSELFRMSLFAKKHPEHETHCICCDTPNYIINMKEYKMFVSWCSRYGVFPHHCYSVEAMIDKLKEIFEFKYQPKPVIFYPKLANIDADMIAQVLGVSEMKAIDISIEMKKRNLSFIPFDYVYEWDKMLRDIFGDKKKGGRKKIVEKILKKLCKNKSFLKESGIE